MARVSVFAIPAYSKQFELHLPRKGGAYRSRCAVAKAMVSGGLSINVMPEQEQAAKALAEAVPTTPAGAAGLVHLMLAPTRGQHDHPQICDLREPETFSYDSGDFYEITARRAGLTIIRALRELGGLKPGPAATQFPPCIWPDPAGLLLG